MVIQETQSRKAASNLDGPTARGAGPLLRVLLIGEHKLIREALARLLQKTSSTNGAIRVDAVDTGSGATERLEATRPNVVLLHVTRPIANSIRLLHLLREGADVPVVVLVDASDEEIDEDVMVTAMQAGAAGCVDSAADAHELAEALEEAANGQIAVSVNCARRLARTFAHSRNGNGKKPSCPDALTAREMETLTLLAHGLTNLEIALELFIAESTVRAHLRTITQKLGAQNRVHAVARALLLGILPESEISRNGGPPVATVVNMRGAPLRPKRLPSRVLPGLVHVPAPNGITKGGTR